MKDQIDKIKIEHKQILRFFSKKKTQDPIMRKLFQLFSI